MSFPATVVKASDTALLPLQPALEPQPNPAIGSAAQTALAQLSAPSPQPFAMVLANDPLRRSSGIPAFTQEQGEYVDALLRRHAVAAAEVPFVHFLHLAVFQHTDALKVRLNDLANQHGTLESFAKKFRLADPYRQASFAFYQIYNSGRRRETLLETGSQVFGKPSLGMGRQAELIAKCYEAMIADLEGKAPRHVIAELKSELDSLRLAWGAALTFAAAVGERPCERMFLRAQLQPLKKPPTQQQQFVSALQQLLREGMQGMLLDYLSFVEAGLPIKELGLHRTSDFQAMTKKKGFEDIISLQGIVFIQDAVCDEIEFVLDCLRRGSPQDVGMIQKVLRCEDMEPQEVASAFEKALALQSSLRMLNGAFGAVAARIGSFDPSYEERREQTLDELAKELGIQRKSLADEEAVLAFLDRMPPPVPRLTAPPSVEKVSPALVPVPAPQSEEQAVPAVSSLSPQPGTPPRTPRREPRSDRQQEPEDRKEMPPSVVSPPRVRAGMNLRQVLRALKDKGVEIIRQKGSHMQLSNGQTLALHPGDTIGPKAAKALQKPADPK